MIDCIFNHTIKIGKVTLTLGLNNGLSRYEGITENSRILISQEPWESWKACIVKRNGKGAIISVSGDFRTPNEAGEALIKEVYFFDKMICEFIGKEDI